MFPVNIIENIYRYLPIDKLIEMYNRESVIDPNASFIKSIICKYKRLDSRRIHKVTGEISNHEIKHFTNIYERNIIPKYPNLIGLKIFTSMDIPFDDHQHLKIKYLDFTISTYYTQDLENTCINKLKNLRSLITTFSIIIT